MGSNMQNFSLVIYLLQFSGPEASVSILTDFICAAQMAREEDQYLPEDDLKVEFIIYLLYTSIKKRCSYICSSLSIKFLEMYN